MSAAHDTPGVAFELDGQPVTAHPGETILKAAQRHGVEIPHLCYTDGLRPDGNCRACVVEIAGERTLAPSCCRAPTEGMKVLATSPRARKSQQMVVEMLLSDMPDQGYRWNDGGANTPELIAENIDPSGGKGLFDSKNSGTIGQHGELSAWADRLGVTVRPALQALRREQPAPDLSHPAMAVNLDACIQCNRC
ncbi:2Fe-2S iron-sulfur cluster-binding protein, partial [Acidovorax sp.]|uniref:2Fe-2S iron-sulfur cluster-binding protein n=2 Tax=unclassified Acidovorax TaxID=2684926 RepID=UPI0025B8F823